MKRLRSRLIAAFVGVTLLAMIPLAIVPYYTLQIKQRNTNSLNVNQINQSLEIDIANTTNLLLRDYVIPVSRRMEVILKDNRLNLVESFRDGVNPERIVMLSNIYVTNFFTERKKRDLDEKLIQDIEFFTKDEYTKNGEWMDKNLFYEEEDTIYLWAVFPFYVGDTREEMEKLGPVGGSFLKIPFIKKNVDNASNSVMFANPIFPLKYNPSLIALPANPALFENFIPRKEFESLFDFDKDGVFEQVEVDSVQIPSIYEGQTVYVLLKPVINHRNELTAVIVIAKRMISIWEILGPSTFTSFIAIMIVIIFAAVLVARSLSRPFYRLASAAHRMGQGDLQTRVEVSGAEEQRVLSYAFNQLAGQIQSQVVQLQQKTTELQEANRELAQTHGFLQNILSNINTGVLSVDTELRISHLNQFGVKLFGVTDFENRDLEQMIRCKSFVNLVRYSLEQAVSVAQQEIQFERSGDELVQLQVSTVPLFENSELAGLVITFHDLTAIRQLEEQVRRQDRLAALGRMAAGVAHEIRNPLGIIRGSAELLYKRVPPESTEQELAQFIVEEVNRLSRVVTDFLTFSRPPEPVIAEIEVHTLFQNAIGYTQNQDEWTNYPIELDLQPDLPDIAVDEKLCRQVFLNLIINARDSMPQGGTITLRAYRINERLVAMEVIDKGVGIQSEQMDRIFDPFYTSKESGTGLGLSLVHQIITNQGGNIEVDSKPGEGSVFRLIIKTYASYCEKNHKNNSVQ